MQTPSILTQVSAPTPPSKVNNGSNDLSKTNVDKNTPSSFKKMLNGEVNQQQKLRNDAANKNKETKKIEQQSNATNEKNSKIEASNKDKSIKPEADKPVEDSSEELDVSNNYQNILNFVANIGLLNDQIQTKFAPSNDELSDAKTLQVPTKITPETLNFEPVPPSEDVDIANINMSEIGLSNKSDLNLSNEGDIDLINRDTTNSTSANNIVSDIHTPKIDSVPNLAPPVPIALPKTNNVIDASSNNDRFKSVSNEKKSKISDRLEISDAVASNTKDVSSKVQFENHIKNTFNTQLQSPPVELDNKTSQDFSAIKVDAMTAQQLGTAHDQVKASAIANYIPAQLGSKAWDQAMGQRIIWMVAGGEQSAQLSLNPPELGPLQVVLKISDNQVDASFISSHLDVRETIESAMPKLRQMMEDAGIQLSGFSVDSQAAQTGKQFNQEQSQQRVREVTSTTEVNTHSVNNTSRSSTKKEIGLVDTFA